jgi:Raf kinase inhibitor-like YbhB/YbcL family protein
MALAYHPLRLASLPVWKSTLEVPAMKSPVGYLPFILLPLGLSASMHLNGIERPNSDDDQHHFRLTSSTFQNKGTLPLSMIFTSPSASNPNLNACTFDGSPGGDQSPELSWTGAPERTRSFVVVMYDVTASFTHWGMYNISPTVHELPQNAGIPGSPYGTQVLNDYGVGDLSYDGPCPPPFLNPVSHTYVFTVYALDTVLPTIPSFGDFQPGSEALYQALIAAGQGGHITRSASITGFFPQPQ